MPGKPPTMARCKRCGRPMNECRCWFKSRLQMQIGKLTGLSGVAGAVPANPPTSADTARARRARVRTPENWTRAQAEHATRAVPV